MKTTSIRFLTRNNSLFFSALRIRVENYFTENKLPKTGGNTLLVKAFCVLALYLVPYLLLVSNRFTSWQMLLLVIGMGIGMAAVGMVVMHDANHGSFSSVAWVNHLFGASIYLLGGNVYNWKSQHNTQHHTYTNILHADEDITGKFLLRLSRQDKRKKIHRYQHVYAFLLYGLMTLSFLAKDFRIMAASFKRWLKGQPAFYSKKNMIRLVIGKISYFVFICAVPLYWTSLGFGQWLIGFFVLHLTAGLILSVIFQLAHLVEGVSQPVLDADGNIANAWAIHQLQTTANFSGNPVLSWFIGGLDYQIEHHLFPTISHIHYKALSEIVKKTAHEFDLPYNAKSSFGEAVTSHVRMLKSLGRTDK